VTPNTCDVAVVGAGPAGAWAARELARRGARVLIFDPSHPREKPCGGGVTGRALALLGDSVDVSRLPSVAIDRAIFRDASGRTVDVHLCRDGTERALLVARRAEFDACILDAARAAGATLVAGRVQDVTREGSHFLLETSSGPCRAAFLIGADGANSLVRRRLSHPFARRQLSIATGFYAQGATATAIVLELLDDPPGYIWSFPRPDHLAIGICAQADHGVTAARLRERTARWITDAAVAPQARLVPYAWPIPSLSAADFETLDVSGAGWIVVGDAAGLVDPITREGIFFALQSAQFAADAVAAGRDVERTYTDRLHAGPVEELSRAAELKAGFFRPRFTRLLLDTLGKSDAIRRVMADLVSGTQGYQGLNWRLARTLEFGLAWRALAGR
jgi:geranylgeranyl reductase family protein